MRSDGWRFGTYLLVIEHDMDLTLAVLIQEQAYKDLFDALPEFSHVFPPLIRHSPCRERDGAGKAWTVSAQCSSSSAGEVFDFQIAESTKGGANQSKLFQ
jgi:hypothetical protein